MKDKKNFKILIVDDEPKNIKLVGNILRIVKNYVLSFATGGKEAINLTKNEDYDLILLDVNMPEVNGFEVCKFLKKHPKTSEIPIIFLTALDDDKNIETGFKLGASDYITKPINKLELVSRVKMIFAFHTNKYEFENLQKEIDFCKKVYKVSLDAQVEPIMHLNKAEIAYCNSALLNLTNCNDIEEFNKQFSTVRDFIYDSNFNFCELDNLTWLENLCAREDVTRVSLKTSDGLKHYILNISKVTDIENLHFIIYFKEINKPNFTFRIGDIDEQTSI